MPSLVDYLSQASFPGLASFIQPQLPQAAQLLQQPGIQAQQAGLLLQDRARQALAPVAPYMQPLLQHVDQQSAMRAQMAALARQAVEAQRQFYAPQLQLPQQPVNPVGVQPPAMKPSFSGQPGGQYEQLKQMYGQAVDRPF